MKNKEFIKKVFAVFTQTAVITVITIFAVQPFSCKITESGIEIVGGDYSAPVLKGLNVIDEKSVEIEFSEEVKLVNAVVSPVIPGLSESLEHSETELLSPAIAAASGKYGIVDSEIEIGQDGKKILFKFLSGTVVGKDYQVLGTVKDKTGNSLTFSIPFTGYNSRIPEIIMTEIHTGMASQLAGEKNRNIRRLEYIQFLALTDGNLVGLEFCSGLYGESKKYVFPAVEVHKGESFVLHPRTWGEGCISETGEDIDLAFSEYTSDSWRDFWSSADGRTIGEKNDILVIRNTATGKIVDAVMYREESVSEWSSKLKMDYSVITDLAEIYPGTDCEYATVTDDASGKLTASNSLRRNSTDSIIKALENGEVIEYPVKVEAEDWVIEKASLPLR